MSKHKDLGQYTVESLGRYFDLVPKDLGEDARRSKRGMTFETKSWEIRGVGHLCVLRMNAFLGLMKMETVVIAPFEADLPLYNADWVKAFGTETQIAELYDTQLEPATKLSSAMDRRYVLWVAKPADDRLILLLDISSLFDLDQILQEENE